MKILFEKWHGCQNDFIVIWTNSNESKYLLTSLQRQANQLCNRTGLGIGADGILVLNKDHGDEFPKNLSIINQDGSLARNCGNGLRCAAASIYQRHQEELKKDEILEQVELCVEGRSFLCQFLHEANSKPVPMIAVDMGLLALNEQNSWHSKNRELLRGEELSDLTKNLGEAFSAEIGNQHIVFLCENCKEPESILMQLGPKLQKTPYWDGINVHIAMEASWNISELSEAKKALGSPIGDLYEAWVYERGVGPTQACGSGACAIGASILSQGFTTRGEWIAIKMPGGTVFVKQVEANEGVLLAGDANFIFSGELNL
ncbi:MAG: diaminopimelate epimerase [Oligoflexales bacterium]